MKLLKLLSLVSLCLLGGCVEEHIIVVDIAGAPIENANVYFQSMSISSGPELTNANGEVIFLDNIQGVTMILVEKNGFQSAHVAVPDTWPIQITLEKE